MLRRRLTISPLFNTIGLGTGVPVSFSTPYAQPDSVSEKVEARLNAASLLPVFWSLKSKYPYSDGGIWSTNKAVFEVNETPYCSVTAVLISNQHCGH